MKLLQCEDWQTQRKGIFPYKLWEVRFQKYQWIQSEYWETGTVPVIRRSDTFTIRRKNIHKPEAGAVLSWEQTGETPGKSSELESQHEVCVYILAAGLTA